MRIVRIGREDLHVEVDMRLLGGDLSVVFDHGRLAMRNINPWLNASCSVLGIRANDLETISIDAPSERVPERVLDHPR